MPLYSLGEQVGFGQIGYPIPIQDGQIWQGQIRFTHTGPAETVRIRIGPHVEGVIQWSEVTMPVEEDATPRVYESPIVSGTFRRGGLGHDRRVDTNMEIIGADGRRVAENSSTDRFKVVVIVRTFTITHDKYGSPAGWGAWTSTE